MKIIMKNIIRKIALSLFIICALIVPLMAQPIPPSTPSGNPVPIGELGAFLSLLAFGMGIFRLRKTNNLFNKDK